jgi:hypothetical protein
MKKVAISLLAAAGLAVTLLAAGPARAHDGKKHFLGTVTKIDPNLLTVETKEGKTVELTLTASTVYMKDKKPAKFEDIGLGDRVVVHATSKGTGFEVTEIEIAPPPKKKPNS